MSTSPVRRPAAGAAASQHPFAVTTPVPSPLMISADEAAELVGVSRATWWAHHASGRCPAPVKLGGRTLWRVQELHDWVAAGCPPRAKWQATLASHATPATARRSNAKTPF